MRHSDYIPFLRGLFFLCLLFGMVSTAISHNLPNSRWPEGWVRGGPLFFEPKIAPNGGGEKKRIRGHVMCYDAYSGRHTPCDFTAEVKRIPEFDGSEETNGGHSHSLVQRDLTFKFADEKPTHLKYPWNTDNNTDPYRIVSKYTAHDPDWDERGGPFFYHPLQESSGFYEVEKIFYVPVGWGCQLSDNFIKYSHIHEHYIVSLGIDGLVKLPTPTATDPYIVGRTKGSKAIHPESVAYWGTPATIFYLKKIATLYHELVLNQDPDIYPELLTKKLSINDISLHRGGLFDIEGNWNEIGGHSTHRNGKDADINRPVLKAGGRLPCMDNYDLRLAVDIILPIPDGTNGTGNFPNSIVNSALLCEGKLNDDGTVKDIDTYHINFDVSLLDLLPINF